MCKIKDIYNQLKSKTGKQISLVKLSGNFRKASLICKEFLDTLKGLKFDEEKDALEIFTIMCVNMCSQHLKAISILLENGLYTESIALSRNIMELLFNLNWIYEADENDKNERTFKLEASPYHDFEKEIKLMEENLSKKNPVWPKKAIENFKNEMNEIKSNFPHLVEPNTHDERKFKKAPPLASRMNNILRLRYYHIYRFVSVFIHPTPFLKNYFLSRVPDQREPIQKIEDSLKHILSYSLLFVELILNYSLEILAKYNPNQREIRETLCKNLIDLVKESNLGYFPDPT